MLLFYNFEACLCTVKC